MTLEYQCSSCGQTLYTAYLKPGETSICHRCSAMLVVPKDAIETKHKPGLNSLLAHQQDSPENEIPATESSHEPLNPPLVNPVLEPNDRFPGFWQAIALLGLFVGLIIVFSVPLGIAQAMFGYKNINTLIIGQVVTAASFFVIYYLGVKRIKRPFKTIFPLGKIPTTLVLPILITIIGAVIVLSEVDNVFKIILPMPEFLKSIFSNLFENRWFFFIGGVIIAPITEEMFCRGLVLRGFLFRYSKPKAIILSAFIFGLAHMNPWQFISASLLGLIFAWWFIKTGSLITTILAHAFVNGIVFVVVLLNVPIPGFDPDVPTATGFQPWWFDLGGIALLIYGLWLFNKITKANQSKADLSGLSEVAPV
jgi:membrane protease YdiL (CAAX protease family)